MSIAYEANPPLTTALAEVRCGALSFPRLGVEQGFTSIGVIMNIEKLIEYSKRPSLYEEGSAVMWTDSYISRQLLRCHIDPDNDLASRSDRKIELIVDWILSKAGKEGMRVLDLGCGPGLYAEKFAKLGHQVVGIDFSKASIEYAKEESRKNRSDIEYHCENYLNLAYEDRFDLVILIYLDFCVLKPAERDLLLKNAHASLKKDGVMIFDVVNGRNIDGKILKQSWEVSSRGFWKDESYIALNDGYHYPEQKVLLNQHIVIDQSDSVESYLFWTTYYEPEDLMPILGDAGFSNASCFENVLPESDAWTGENVTFYVAEKA
jgi:SAM-dependent methyltransferase